MDYKRKLNLSLSGNFLYFFLILCRKKDKNLKYYNTAYENIKLIAKYYTEIANYSIKENDFSSLISNYETLLRNEELRYVIFF